jgi:hypothetical protein
MSCKKNEEGENKMEVVKGEVEKEEEKKDRRRREKMREIKRTK